MNTSKTWFGLWFNTSYYHILYKHRNDDDAQVFMKNLVTYLNIPKQQHLLDLACGKGRHSIYLNQLGYTVTGADLSSESILHANTFANEQLNFMVQDMRLPFEQKFNAIFNLFTSFGYFEDDSEDIQVLQNINDALETDGVAVLDYLNVNKVIPNLVENEIIDRDGILFHINRSVQNDFIIKDICFEDQGEKFEFQERVKVLDIDKFKNYATKANLKIKHIFGDYHLNTFDKDHSDRLILIFTR